MLLGYDQRYKADETLRFIIDELSDNMRSNEELRDGTRNLAETMNQKLQAYNKLQYERHKKYTAYQEGDLVLVRILQRKPGENQKLLPKYKGIESGRY